MALRCLVALAFIGVVPACPAWGQTSLRWHFAKGETFALETTCSVKITYGGQGATSFTKAAATLTKVLDFKVLEQGQGGVVLEQRIRSAKIHPEESSGLEVAALLKSLPGKVLTLHLNQRGEITKVVGFPELFQKVCQEQGAAPVELEALLTEETIRQEVQWAFLLGPVGPAQAGDTWRRRVGVLLAGEPVGFLGQFQTELEFRYVGTAKEGERVVVRGRPCYVPPAPGATIYPYTLTKGIFRRMQAQGEFLVNAGTGRLVRQEFRLAFDGTFTQNTGGGTQDMEIGQELVFKARLLEKTGE
jgi:hypothetical protein